jgi:hypothetical protein
MLSAAPPPHSFLSTQPSPWREARVLYRRICVLEATGKQNEADTLRAQQLVPAIEALRGTPAVGEDQLEAMFAAEEERVATAHTLAEILLPLLTEKISASAATAYRPASQSPNADYASLPTNPAAAPSIDSVRDRAASPLLPGIADFIDEMLMQDRPASNASATRRSA